MRGAITGMRRPNVATALLLRRHSKCERPRRSHVLRSSNAELVGGEDEGWRQHHMSGQHDQAEAAAGERSSVARDKAVPVVARHAAGR